MLDSLDKSQEEYTYRGRKIKALYGSEAWHNFISNTDNIFKYKIGYVPLGFEARPDLISDVFFDTPELWWLLLRVNNIKDPFEDLTPGTRIRIPTNEL